jgi:hypothetical protein
MRSLQIRIEMKASDMTNRTQNAHPESGQTIALVAVAMMGILIIAALAIDLTTLYVAHGEIQRAADSAALAGAKAFVDSGVTTYPSNPNLQTLAQTLAVDYATSVANQNNVAGAPATFTVAPQVDLSRPGNPEILVTLQRTGLPLFFARIWGSSVASVSATAIAEAYNPAYAQTNTGAFLPPAPKCFKPFLVPNSDQNQGVPFVDPNTGAVQSAPTPFIGETITLTSACGVGPGCASPSTPVPGLYLPMLLSDNHHYCPANGSQGCSSVSGRFQGSTQCCDGTAFNYAQCGVPATPGSAGSVPVAKWDQNTNPAKGGKNGQAQDGLQCLIHNNPSGNPPQDTLNNISQANTGLLQIQPGDFSQRRYGLAQGSIMSTSDSIITVPLFDASVWPPQNPPQVNIVGFLQLFVNYAGPTPPGPSVPPAIVAPQGDMNATILNVIGCGSSLAGSSAISGGGASAIPVRLIHN